MLRFTKKYYQFYKCLNAQFTHKADSQNSSANVMLVWWLKQVKDLILEFLTIGSFLTEKNQLTDYYTVILVSFPSGECVDEVFNSQANYQEYRFFP